MRDKPVIQVQIIHIQGPLKGRIQEFIQDNLSIGRHPSCDLAFPKDLSTLSRRHAEIVREGNRFKVIDKSTNGTFVNGKQIKEAITVHERLDETSIRDRCIKLLRDVGIPSPEERLNDYPHQLSGGQRQRIMIAMALACNPDLVIADEPTTALDVTIQKQILKLFKELQAKMNMSLLYITHDLNVVANIADRIYVMYAGTMVEQGIKSDILARPRHPYTRGLLASLPHRSKRGTTLHSIPGSVPDPAFKPEGCPFHPRCRHAVAACRRSFPELCDYGEGHLSRCPVLYGLRGQD